MTTDLSILSLARGLATHATARQSVIAENIANSDTPGYRARDIPAFADVFSGDDPPPLGLRTTRSGHIAEMSAAARFGVAEMAAFGAEAPNGNTVSLEDQMMRSADTRAQHDLALGVYSKTMDLMRAAIGRGR